MQILYSISHKHLTTFYFIYTGGKSYPEWGESNRI